MVHWTEQYIGKSYVDGEYDCASLLEDVQRNVFHRNVYLPKERKNHIFQNIALISKYQETYFEPVPYAQEGDAVLMQSCVGRLNHIGVFAIVGDIRCVLHNLKNTGSVCLHKIRDLNLYGLSVEGYYRPKETPQT